MTRRKSLARRWPVVLYRIDLIGTDLVIKAWEADEFGHIVKDRYLGVAKVTGWDAEHVKGCWALSNDTDAIYALPEDAREGVWQFDDAIRDTYKKRAFDWMPE